MRHVTAYRVTGRKFDMMRAAELFEDDKVELLNGSLTMMTTGPAHDNAVNSLDDLLSERLPKVQWLVRTEQPVKLGLLWRPLPDVVVARGPRSDFANRTPGRNDFALIVEVSDTTYAKDAGIKLRRYERSGLPYYWVVDLTRRRVEVREMSDRRSSVTGHYGENEEVPLVLDGKGFGPIPVRQLLP